VDLPDFETGQPMRISLDPALSIRENIEKRYAHAKRMSKSRAQIQSRLASAQERKGVLEDLRQKLDKANDASVILELSPEIDAACAPDEKNRANTPQKSKSAVKVSVHKPYKTFKSADGTLILVGKSAKDNDDLTFHHTRGNDTWLHVSGMPGSHVVVKSAEPSQETLIDAALLAMHYSKLARADRVEVHVTQVKYVRKPKGAPDGKVEIRGERAILARASEKRLARLMQTEC
jgi:predicted ribosome quality control (RQC) complex YloA/Tae2 family protein